MTMGDVQPDPGPFEFIGGSHRWPCLRNTKVKGLVKPEVAANGTHEWAIAAEYHVNKSVENYIRETSAEVQTFEAQKDDILIWQGRLMHRGSDPRDSALLRPGLISHYSGVRSRRDLAEISRHRCGSYYWEFDCLGRPETPGIFARTDALPNRAVDLKEPLGRFGGLLRRSSRTERE